MAASLSFKQADRQTDAINSVDAKTIIYEDNTGNKYTFGVGIDNTFDTFKYKPNSADPEVDYSSIATTFMTNSAVATLLGKLNAIPNNLEADVTAIKAKTDNMPDNLGNELGTLAKSAELAPLVAPLAKSADVTTIKTKTDNMPDNLVNELGKLATSATLETLDGKVATIKTETDKIAVIGTNVGKIKTKTDTIPDDLGAELDKLTVIGNAINSNGNVTEAAKGILENSFKKAIEKAGENGSDWLENRVADIVSQPKFDIPTSDDVALNWTW